MKISSTSWSISMTSSLLNVSLVKKKYLMIFLFLVFAFVFIHHSSRALLRKVRNSGAGDESEDEFVVEDSDVEEEMS
jgi:hypothetical protein